MLAKLKENWQGFKDAKPGHRFQRRFVSRQRESEGRLDIGMFVNIAAGLVVTVIGIILIPAPGPGILIVFAGLGLIGSEFLPLARALDWAELRLRAIRDWAISIWERIPLGLKILAGVLVLLCAAGAAHAAYQFFLADAGPDKSKPRKAALTATQKR